MRMLILPVLFALSQPALAVRKKGSDIALTLPTDVYGKQACLAIVKYGFAGRAPFVEKMVLYELISAVLKCYPDGDKLDAGLTKGLEAVTPSVFKKRLAALPRNLKARYQKRVGQRCDAVFDNILLFGS
ncbi:MAG: hypothetical protein M1549_01635 [Candidatus Dependentiae bacterium]|nr:hypothetical protein [Candidatus Dependentiae bacterium]